ncbi:MAG: zinc-ribbon domain-containing protein [Oscillospiraceae bacterium]|jgi:hypothetical protein|nr:zinc-ribbon domain-containing protein [Oscillospiraceae bacterium]
MYAKKLEFLKGLMAGLTIDRSTNEYKLFSAVIETLDAMSEALTDAEEDIAALEDSVDELDDDLDGFAEMMDALSGMDDDDDDDDDDDNEDDDDDDEEDEYEITCPGCENVFVVDEETIFRGGVSCPSCGKKLNFEIGGCEDCQCGHCHDHDHDHGGDGEDES